MIDGNELKYWNETKGLDMDTAVKYCHIPDVDNDSIPDGKEIKGWTVKIIVGYDEENNPTSKDVTLYGDPLAAYRALRKEDGSLGDYIDSDDDNIPDIVESLLSNNSTFVKFADWALNNDLEAWNDYSWCIAYFYLIALGEEFSTVYDDIKNNKISAIKDYENEIKAVAHNDKYKAQIENATSWLRDEFNPLITESMAPVITEFHVSTIYEGYVAPLVPNAKAHVVAEIRDVAGISRVRIKSVCPDVFGIMTWTIAKEYDGPQTSVYLDEIIDVTEYSAVLTYNISVNATDTLGNSAEWYKEVDGPVGAFIKTVANMLRAFWNFLCEVGKVLVKAFEILIEWVKEIIWKGLNSILVL